MTTGKVLLVISNCPPDAAETIARALIERRHAACVTLSPVKSIYCWRDDICVDAEITLTAKVSATRVDGCVSALRALHPYEVPEILVLRTEPSSLEAYCTWVEEECAPKVDG